MLTPRSHSAEPFYADALQAYLRLFPFEQLALDIALRVFLCSASLPSETQQIDRVMEAFARRYVECNPGLFGPAPKKRDVGDEGLSAEGTEEGRIGARKDGQQESDIPYVLAFSMVMLNTDHFNPNAKSKMCINLVILHRRLADSAVSPGRKPTTSRTLASTAFRQRSSRSVSRVFASQNGS